MDTPVTLLMRLRKLADKEAWNRFVWLYTPLLYHWTWRTGLQGQDADDLVQDVLLTLVQTLPSFTYDPRKSFRSWLRTILMNKWRAHLRHRHSAPERDVPLVDVPGPNTVEAFWEDEYHQYIVGRALRLIQTEFQPTTWKACWEYVVRGRPVAEVADELGVSVHVIYSAKCRILRRLRRELQELLE